MYGIVIHANIHDQAEAKRGPRWSATRSERCGRRERGNRLDAGEAHTHSARRV